jgi:hypothetical protein
MPAARSSSMSALVPAAIACAGIVLATGASLRAARGLRATWPREADTLLLPSPRILRILDLGHHEMAADLVAARANVYFGSQIASRGDQRWLARTLETAVELDPQFHRLYLRGAAMLVYTGNDFTVEALLAANSLLERGRRAFPGDWELPFQAGFNLLFELPKLVGEDDARVFDWRQSGVEALRQATLLDGAPPWLPNLAARMLTKQGGQELAIRHLEQTFEITNNPETRVEIARRLAVLRGQRRADELRKEAEAFERATTGQYPYAPEAFSVVLGPRVPLGVDFDLLLGRNPTPSPPGPAP